MGGGSGVDQEGSRDQAKAKRERKRSGNTDQADHVGEAETGGKPFGGEGSEGPPSDGNGLRESSGGTGIRGPDQCDTGGTTDTEEHTADGLRESQ